MIVIYLNVYLLLTLASSLSSVLIAPLSWPILEHLSICIPSPNNADGSSICHRLAFSYALPLDFFIEGGPSTCQAFYVVVLSSIELG